MPTYVFKDLPVQASPATLAAGMTNVQTSLTLSTGTGVLLPAPGVGQVAAVRVENEIIVYTTLSGDTLSGLTRGYAGTAAVAHVAGRQVRNVATAEYLNSAGGVSGVGTDHGGLTGLLDDDHPQYQLRGEKNNANGYAGLNASVRVPTTLLGSGTPSTTTFLRGDQTWAVPPAGGGGVTDHGALTGLGDNDHTQYQLRGEKGVANGYAGLGSTGLVPMAQLATGTPDGLHFIRDDGVLAVPSGSGVTDHGLLTGLADDDHPQYATDVDLSTHTANVNAHHNRAHDHTTADGSGVLTNDEHDGYSEYVRITADPAAPGAGSNRIRIYSKDNAGVATLYYINEVGQIYEIPTLTTGGGSGAPSTATYVTMASESMLTSEAVLGTGVIMAGTAAGRPTATVAGRLYWTTDTFLLFRDTGTGWTELARGEPAIRLSQLAERSHDSLTALTTGNPHTQYVLGSVATTKGDLLVRDASTIVRLPVGTNGQALLADSTQTLGVRWGAVSGGGLATDPLADAKGDLFAASAADTIGRLAVGTNGQVLTADSTQTLGVTWGPAGLVDPTTAPGDLLARNVGGAAAYLATPGSTYTQDGTPDGNPYEFAEAFSCASAQVVAAIGWYRQSTGQTVPPALRVWDSTTSLAVVTITSGIVDNGAVGWQFTTVTGPAVTLVAGRQYRVAYAHPGGAHLASSQFPTPDAGITDLGTRYATGMGNYPNATHTLFWGVSIRVTAGPSQLSRVPVGSNGQVLTADNTVDLGVKWATPAASGMSNPMTSKGDVIVGSAGPVNYATPGQGATSTGWPNTPANLIDSNDATSGASQSNPFGNSDNVIDLGAARLIGSFRILHTMSTSLGFTMDISWSTDNATYTSIWSSATQVTNQDLTYTLPTSVTARYWRLRGNSGGSGQWTVYSFELRSPGTVGFPMRLGVGANGQVLTADSAQTNGVKWAANIGAASHEEFLPAASATTVTLANTPGTLMMVARNGVIQSSADGHYSLSGAVLTFASAFSGSERVVAAYVI